MLLFWLVMDFIYHQEQIWGFYVDWNTINVQVVDAGLWLILS